MPPDRAAIVHRVPTRAVAVFFPATFAITWGIVGSYILIPEAAAALFGEIGASHPLYFIATWAPAISGLGSVLINGIPSVRGV